MIRSNLRCNEKEISQVSTKLPSSKEGILQKKGPSKGQGYKPRWCRLCGNLLFYFKVEDEAQLKNSEPTGLIVLEGSKVQRSKGVTDRPFAFQIAVQGDERSYQFAAANQADMDSWITALDEGSYEFLRRKMCRLQNKVMLLSGRDPLTEGGFNKEMSLEMKSRSERAGAVGTILRSEYQKKKSPEALRRFVPSFRKQRSSSRATPLSTTALLSTMKDIPTVDVCIGCSHLPLLQNMPPNSFVEVSLRRSPPDTTEWIDHAETEVIEASNSPIFFTVIAVPADPRLELDIRFSVFAVQGNAADDEDQLIISSLGHAECSFHSIVQDVNQRIRLTLVQDGLSDFPDEEGTAVVKASILQADEDDRRASVVTRREPSIRQRSSQISIHHKGKLKPHLSKLFQCRFIFPSKSGELIRVAEEIGESALARSIPISALKLFNDNDMDDVDDICTQGDLAPHWQERTQQLLGHLFTCAGERHHALDCLEKEPGVNFKASVQKKEKSRGFEFVPTNLHVQRMKVLDLDGQVTTHNVTTVGAFACHSRGFRQGGLHRIINESSLPPTFVNDADSASKITRIVRRQVGTIRQHISELKRKLFQAAANRNTAAFSSSLSELSAKVQSAVSMCTKPPVSGALQAMKQARTYPSSELLSAETQARSPQDWIWNGVSYLTLAKWNVDDHMKTIQEQMMSLLSTGEKVETAISALLAPRVDPGQSQFYEVSPRTGHMSLPRNLSPPTPGSLNRVPSIRRPPPFCWSYQLLDALNPLCRSLESLLEVVDNSMVFNLIQMNASYADFDQLLLRHDIVMSQALAALVTSFNATLWSNISSKVFMRLLQDIGFMAHFESLLSTQGDEKGMLEDMWFAVRQLNNVTFHIVRVDNGEVGEPKITGARHDMHIHLPLQESLFVELPSTLKKGDGVRVKALLFTQGINEQQTLADLNFVSRENQIQSDINMDSFLKLEEFVRSFCALCVDVGTAKLSAEASILPGLLARLDEEIRSSKTKNVDILQLSEEISQRAFAGRLTSCKSAKDRTAMAVTLEQCNALKREHGLLEKDMQQALDSMRSRGTRLYNCQKNVGIRRYAFNSFQLKCVPALYCPPTGTYGKKVQA